jgi:hypothetical protein
VARNRDCPANSASARAKLWLLAKLCMLGWCHIQLLHRSQTSHDCDPTPAWHRCVKQGPTFGRIEA